MIPNAWLRDARLSRRARGLLVELMSHRPGWIISVASLQEGGPEGRDAVLGAIRELEAAGYLLRARERREDGTLGAADWVIQAPAEAPMDGKPVTGQPAPGNPTPKKNTLQKTPIANAIGVNAGASGTRIPEPFMVTAEMKQWAQGEGIQPDDVARETPIFVDYWRGRSGQIAVKRDWPATWRNWMRRAVQDRRQPSGPSRETPAQRVARIMAMAEGLDQKGLEA